MVMGCTADRGHSSAEAMRSVVLDGELAAIAANLALAREYVAYNQRTSCRFARIPEAAHAALSKTGSADPRFREQVNDYERALARIYHEERAFCDVYRKTAAYTDTLARNALTHRAPPSADLYLFYATPKGIMRDIRVANDRWVPGMDISRVWALSGAAAPQGDPSTI